jgi:hypothetical protein
MADGSTKPIGSVQLGDKVASTDPKTGRDTAQPVVVLHDNHDTDLADVTVASSDGTTTTLHTTWHHPFWNETAHQWTDAADLKPGTALHVRDSDQHSVQVLSAKTWTGQHDMRDLTVAQTHTYYVAAGSTPVLVHNSDCLHGTGPQPGVFEIGTRSKSASVFKNTYLKPGGKGAEYVFDPTTNRLAAGAPARIPGGWSPHQQLAAAMDADESKVVAGMMYRQSDGVLQFNENSGHYGDRWTDELRSQFANFLTDLGIPFNYEQW